MAIPLLGSLPALLASVAARMPWWVPALIAALLDSAGKWMTRAVAGMLAAFGLTFVALDFAVDSFEGYIQASFSGLPAFVWQMFDFFAVPSALSIIVSAYVAAASMSAVRLGMKRD